MKILLRGILIIGLMMMGILMAGCGSREIKIASITEEVVTNTTAAKQQLNENSKKYQTTEEESNKEIEKSGLNVTTQSISTNVVVDKILKNMTLEDKISQMFIVPCNKGNGLSITKKTYIGGILFTENEVDLKNDTEVLQNTASFPLLIGTVDKEKNILEINSYNVLKKIIDNKCEDGIYDSKNTVLQMSNNIIKSFDKNIPCSLSLTTHNVIREDLNYDGVILSGYLDDKNIESYNDNIVLRAILAGNDMIYCKDFYLQNKNVIQAVKSGKLTEDRINESVRRIIKLKCELGIINTGN